MTKMNIKSGDTVLVLAGKDNGKTGKITAVYPQKNLVVVENVNIHTKHKKARNAQEKSGIEKKEAPFDASNVQVICPVCGKATRVAHKIEGDKKERICKKCGASLDVKAKEAKKEVKKSAKVEKAEKEAAKEVEVKEAKKATKATATKEVEAKEPKKATKATTTKKAEKESTTKKSTTKTKTTATKTTKKAGKDE